MFHAIDNRNRTADTLEASIARFLFRGGVPTRPRQISFNDFPTSDVAEFINLPVWVNFNKIIDRAMGKNQTARRTLLFRIATIVA